MRRVKLILLLLLATSDAFAQTNVVYGNFFAQGTGTQITAAATIAPTASIQHITGATAVVTITPPPGFASGIIELIPDSAITWTAAGNISVAGTAVVNQAIFFAFDGTKWNPSYVSAGSGGGSGALTLIQTQTLGSAAASVTFSSIPGTYTNLKLVSTAASASGSADNLVAQFNGDTASHYQTQFVSGTGSTASASAISSGTTEYLGNLTGTNVSSYPGVTDSTIFGYAGTTFYKGATGTSTSNGSGTTLTTVTASGYWDSTAAITSILLKTGSGSNLVAGSTFSLYGMQ